MSRYPLAALFDAIGMGHRDCGNMLGMSGRTRGQLLHHGLDDTQADRYATRAGFHPAEVWPDYLDNTFDMVSVECAARACQERFVPYRPQQRYCSRVCGNRERQRGYLAAKRKDPSFRQAETVRMRQYRSAAASRVAARLHRERNRDAVNAYRRAWRARKKVA